MQGSLGVFENHFPTGPPLGGTVDSPHLMSGFLRVVKQAPNLSESNDTVLT